MPVCSIGMFVALVATPPVMAAANATACDRAAEIAARRTGVPVAVLWAITRTETGRRRAGQVQPWPWTVNMEGKGVWFDTEVAARTYVDQHFKRGARSFDVGCFQINYKWHGAGFSSLHHMFDPQANANYAARFLLSLYQEMGNWRDAAGAYHSRTPKYATRYKARFDDMRRLFAGADDQGTRQVAMVQAVKERAGALRAGGNVAQPKPRPPRQNRFPLLQAGSGAAGLGSLVRFQAGRSVRPLFDRPSPKAGQS